MLLLHLDLSQILDLVNLKDKTDAALKDAVRDLSAQMHSHIIEQAQSKLHSTREPYIKALSISQVDADTWLINLDQSAMWIEEGIEHNKEMIDDLLKSSKAKTAKDGSKYMAIPFQHNKPPSQQTPAQKSLTDTIKKEFENRKIPYGKVETDASGNAKKGLLHSFSITNSPIKTGPGVGQGHGPVGAVKQGATGIPFLRGIRVYQKDVKDPVSGKSSTQKAIMTFRIVSSKMKGSGRWVHPGLEPRLFLDEAVEWGLRQWEEKIKDKVIESISKA